MGCNNSKAVLNHVDDSVHVMLSHERKMARQKGLPQTHSYVPRAEHPMLRLKEVRDEAQSAKTEETD